MSEQRSEVVVQNRYSTVIREIIKGNEYLKFSSSHAVAVLLLGPSGSVYLMAQEREDSGGREFFKTVGGYLNPEETPTQGAVRNLRSKLGVSCSEESLYELGILSGYGDAIKVPITLLVCEYKDWLDYGQRATGIRLIAFDQKEVIELLATRDIYDDATRLQLLYWLIKKF